MQEVKLPTVWVRSCVYYGKDRSEFIYRVTDTKGTAVEGYAGRSNITTTIPLPEETPRELAARLKAGDRILTLWGGVETRLIKEQDGTVTVILPDNKIVEMSENRVLTRDRE